VQKGKERQEQRARLAEMSPDERMAFELGQLSADQFRTKLDNFEKLAEEEREGIVRALAGERSHFWGLTKETAQSGPAKKRKRARILEQELRKVSKKLGGILK